MKQASAGRRIAWLIATRNSHKVEEIRAILGEKFDYLTLKDLSDAPSVVEDAPDFAGNATKKAVELNQWIGARIGSVPAEIRDEEAWVLADDSGLEVDALNGAPGVHSARFAALDSGNAAAGNSKDAENNAKLLRLLRDVPLEKRTARFRCVIAVTPVVQEPRNSSNVCLSNEAELRTQLFDGTCEGRMAFEPSGKGGFGYDPLFIPNGFKESFAELGEEVKNRLSHRARALEKLREVFVSGS
jgi:XTP/dITP diphosphohydrolase